VRAFDADGKRLGTFGTDREAMREILERARAVREEGRQDRGPVHRGCPAARLRTGCDGAGRREE